MGSNVNHISTSYLVIPNWTRSSFSLRGLPIYLSPELMGSHQKQGNSHYNSKLLLNPIFILSSLTGGAILSSVVM